MTSASDTGVEDYLFSQDGLFVIPIEHLSPKGIEPAFAVRIEDRGAMDRAAIELFDRAFGLYWRWATDLSARAPAYWPGPRLQHVCVATAPERIRPYFQPFNKSSWLLCASDFRPETSSAELAAYLFLHVERMGLLREIEPTMIANLGAFLALPPEAVAGLVEGCRRTTRPDAAGFRALAEHMPAVLALHHATLRPLEVIDPGSMRIPNTGVDVGAAEQPAITALHQAWVRAAAGAIERHRVAHAAPASDGGRRISDWLASARPPLLVTGPGWRILWDPDAPEDVGALGAFLDAAGVSEAGARGVLQDLQVVERSSRRFLDGLRDPGALVDPAPYITEGGLSYIHKTRKLIAYHIGPGENERRLFEPSPPFERFMLAARTIHEWGHLAAESGWIAVPEARRAERKALRGQLEALLETIHAEAPPAVRARAAREVDALVRRSGRLGSALVKGLMARIEDYQSNLLARRFLSADEMDTYVRNNVSAHLDEYSHEAVFGQLTRHAYEIQYLRLSRIPAPLDWFRASTWFEARFVRTGIVTMARFEELVDLIGRICDLYAVDESRFAEGGAARPPTPAGAAQ